MAKKLHGLGRGLDALLPEAPQLEAGLQEIGIGEIDPNPNQPRRAFRDESLAELAQSIREQGVLQPLLVVPTEGGRYRIVAGERRWRAARLAGLATVPCVVRELDALQQMEAALVENLQREDLNAIDMAAGIRALMEDCGLTQEETAQRIGKSRPAVANALRLLSLPQSVQDMVREGSLSAGHARVLAGLDDEGLQKALARDAVRNTWSVRELEQIAAAQKHEPETAGRRHLKNLPPELTELETRLRETLGLRATLSGSVKKGRIVLRYSSAEELERFNDLLLRLSEEN